MSQPDGTRLNSWKEIAAYLGRDERTARRWERERGMPIRRVPGGQGGSVFAYTAELDAWLLRTGVPPASSSPGANAAAIPEAEPARRSKRPGRGMLVTVAALAILILLGAAWLRGGLLPRVPAIHALALDRNELRALDDGGRVRWTYRFDETGVFHAPVAWTSISEPDEAGNQLIVANVEVPVPGARRTAGALYAFDASGRLRWRHIAADRFRFAGGEYGPPWPSQGDLIAFTVGGERRLAWALHHDTWWPSLVAILDADGRVRDRFVNAGWILRLFASSDGRFLFAAGVSNAEEAPIVAALDTGRPSGRSPEADGSSYACLDCPAGHPARYFVFPRSAVSRAARMRLEAPRLASLNDGIEIRILENADSVASAESIYEFSPTLELRRANRNDIYWEWRRRLEAARLLVGSGGNPGAAGADDLIVRAWDPSHGWQVLRPTDGATPALPPRR